jgi:hypothetical protein
MHITFDHNGNLLGGPQGPPNTDTVPLFSPWIPILDPDEVWGPRSRYDYVSCLRLTPDELQTVQEATGWEPLGRYGDYSDGSNIVWSFASEKQGRDTMNRACAALAALRPRNTSQAPSASAGGRQDYEAETPGSTIQSPDAGTLDDHRTPTEDRPWLLPEWLLPGFDDDKSDVAIRQETPDYFKNKPSKTKPRPPKPTRQRATSSGSCWEAAQAELRRKTRAHNFRA